MIITIIYKNNFLCRSSNQSALVGSHSSPIHIPLWVRGPRVRGENRPKADPECSTYNVLHCKVIPCRKRRTKGPWSSLGAQQFTSVNVVNCWATWIWTCNSHYYYFPNKLPHLLNFSVRDYYLLLGESCLVSGLLPGGEGQQKLVHVHVRLVRVRLVTLWSVSRVNSV